MCFAPLRSELCNLKQYLEKHRDNDTAMVFDLGQDAENWPMESKRGAMPCIMRGTNMLFATVNWRWLTGRELLLAQGFPLCLPAKMASEPCIFDHQRQVYPRRRPCLFRQSGNSMNVHMIGASMLYAFLFVDPVKAPAPTAEYCKRSRVSFWELASKKHRW